MPAELTITRDAASGAIVLTGELDTHTSPQLQAYFATVAPAEDIVVDLAAVTFISSAGLSVLLNAQRELVASGGSLVVVEPGPAVLRLIQLSGLSETLGLS